MIVIHPINRNQDISVKNHINVISNTRYKLQLKSI